MKNLSFCLLILLLTYKIEAQKVIIKGIPFVTRTRIPVKESTINLIKKTNQKQMTYFFFLKNKEKISNLDNYLQVILRKNKIVNVDYNIRMEIHFDNNKVYYLDQYQRVIFKGKAYDVEKEDLEKLFSTICKPEIITRLGGLREDYYWRYSPKCN
jgi:hypothetical protein